MIRRRVRSHIETIKPPLVEFLVFSVLVVCLETSDNPTINDRRNFLLAMSQMGMATSDYVVLYLENFRQQGFGRKKLSKNYFF
jgi:hypothetical protein